MEKYKLLKHPFISIIVWLLAGTIAVSLIFPLVGWAIGVNTPYEEYIVILLSIIGAVLLLFVFWLIYRPHFKGFGFFKSLMQKDVLVYMLAFMVVDVLVTVIDAFITGIVVPSPTSFLYAAYAGICEETTDRLIPLAAAMFMFRNKKTSWAPLIFTAIFFGLTHYINLDAETGFMVTSLQVFSATFAGLFMGALYLRTGSLLPGILVHFIHNSLSYANAEAIAENVDLSLTAWDVVEVVIIAAVQLVLTIILLKGKQDKVQAVWNKVWLM